MASEQLASTPSVLDLLGRMAYIIPVFVLLSIWVLRRQQTTFIGQLDQLTAELEHIKQRKNLSTGEPTIKTGGAADDLGTHVGKSGAVGDEHKGGLHECMQDFIEQSECGKRKRD